MTTSVTAPLERQLGQMPSLEEMSSSSSAGASIITLRCNLNLNLDIAEQEVQAAINAANNLLPSDLPAPRIYAKVNPADALILTLALTSKTLPLPEVADMADTRLVVLVVFLFLRNLRATIIPSLSVPLSLVGTLSAKYLLGFNLDNLSLMAFTIATGFVVDDGIVVIENISRYIEMGESPLEAALKGSKQIGFTIVSLTISLIAVHFPLLFMGDVIGRLVHEFSVTSVVTIVLSAVVSLMLVPMMCAKMLRHQTKVGRFERLSRQTVAGMIKQYGRLLIWVLRHQVLTLLIAIGMLMLTIWLYFIIPKGFFPVQDTGLIEGVTQAPQSTSYDAMVRRQGELAKKILKDADVVNLSSFVGVDGSNTTLNSGQFLIALKPHDERQLTSQEIVRRIESEAQGVEGITLFLQPVQDLTTDTAVSATQYQFVLENANPNELKAWVPKLVSRLQNVPQITDLASDLQQSGLSANITIDRKSAARLELRRLRLTTRYTTHLTNGLRRRFLHNPINTGSSSRLL
jgi:multidrug efflux pump